MQSFIDLVNEIKKDSELFEIWKTEYDLNYLYLNQDLLEQLTIEKIDLENVR